MRDRAAGKSNAVLWRRQETARPDVLAPPAPARRPPAPDVLHAPALRRRPRPAPAPAPPPPRAPADPRPRKPSTPPPPLSDLDVHVAHAAPAPCPARRPASPDARPPRLVRPARCGTLISTTVDVWARDAAAPRPYRPLVFGGTYPIDEPASPDAAPAPAPADAAERRRLRATIERSLDRFEAILARRAGAGAGGEGGARTFELDAPAGAVRAPASPRRAHASYYVAGPSTWAVDEPLAGA